MTGTTHQMAALVAGFTLLILHPVALGPVLGTLAVVSVMIGALTPDLDQPTANIWRRVIGGNTVGNIFQTFSGGHRHFTHSVLGIITISWCLNWVITHIINTNLVNQASALSAAFMVGYISHPILDSFTDRGVPWLWPHKAHFKIPPGPEEMRVTTNSFVERIIIRSGIIVITVLLLQKNWEILINLFR